ncbi:MAG TPA: cyclic nucleotide-binding domain-containing protein [Devosia sp.]|nr:cyclic nucleotide-binding domain-containing protein [Devosia sp.]
MDDDGSMARVLAYCDGFPLDRFAPGDVLIAEGPPSDRMFILAVGEVEVMRGDTQVADTAIPGSIFGEISALLGGPHTATVRAVTATTAFRIEDARALLQSHRELSYHVSRILARRLTDATSYLADIKRQFADRADHLGMVDQVLDALVQRQRPAVSAGPSVTDDRL